MSNIDKFNKYVELLKELNDKPEAKSELDNFFNVNAKNIKNIPDNMHYSDFEEMIADSFSDLIHDLGKRFDLNRDAISAYFSMDTALLPKLDEHDTRSFEIQFYFELENDLSLRLNGRNILEVYDYAVEEAISFLQNNIELFPKSTQTLITSKKSIFDNFKFINVPSLSNDFNTKAFANALSEIPCVHDLKIYLRRFSASLDNSVSNLSTLYFNFYEALEIKYSDVKDSEFNTYKEEIFNSFFEQFAYMKDNYGVRVDYKNMFDKYLKRICQSDCSLNYSFNAIKENNVLKLCKIFEEFTKSEDHLECVNSVFLNKLSKELNTELLDFNKLPVNLQQELILQSKKHYYENDKACEVYVYEIPEIVINDDDEIPF